MTGTKIVYAAKDVETAKSVYTPLFGQPHTDTPYYVGYNLGGQEIGVSPNGNQDVAGVVVYWPVSDVAAKVAELTAAGASVLRDTADVGGGTVLAIVADPEGNPIGLIKEV